jgi:hypothetical protein
VYWDAASCREQAQVVWASQSAAEQRAGRTGRTCAGFCYRLLPRAAFLKLDRWAALLLLLLLDGLPGLPCSVSCSI